MTASLTAEHLDPVVSCHRVSPGDLDALLLAVHQFQQDTAIMRRQTVETFSFVAVHIVALLVSWALTLY